MPKRIIVEGAVVKLGHEAALDKWLKGKGFRCVLDSDGDEVVDFESLVDGGTYTLGPPIQQHQQQQQRSVCSISFLIKGGKESLGAPGNLYKTLQATLGHYSEFEGILIDYDGRHLRGKAYFVSYSDASPFTNRIHDWETHKELVHLEGVNLNLLHPPKQAIREI